MARARESESLGWLATFNVATPKWVLVARGSDTATVTLPGPGPWMVKPDVAMGGKGLKNLVHRCDNQASLDAAIRQLFAEQFYGEPLAAVIIEEYVSGDEFFLSVAIDANQRGALLRFAPVGGVGFDAHTTPNLPASLTTGIDQQRLHQQLTDAGFVGAAIDTVKATFNQLWDAFLASEAVLIEINPLKFDGTHGTAVGVAVEFDPHSAAHVRLQRPALDDHLGVALGRAPTVREIAVAEADQSEPDRPGMTFFELDGDIAFVVAGGGAALFTFDYLHDHGLAPACYTDYSPGGGVEKLTALFVAALSIPQIRGVFVGVAVLNVMDTQFFADALLRALDVTGIDPAQIPIVARIAGPGEEVTLQRLRAIEHVHVFGREETLEHAGSVLVAELAKQVRS